MDGETDSDMLLMIQGFCMTLILLIGVLETPGGCFKAIHCLFFRVYRVHIVIQSNLVCFWLVKTDFDIHLIIQEASMILISNTTNRGLGRPGTFTCFKVPPGLYFRIYSAAIVLQPNIVCFGLMKNSMRSI